MNKLKIAVILGSIREGRFGETPARWIHDIARARSELDVSLLDLRDHPLPLFDDRTSPAYGESKYEEARAWQKTVGAFDAFILVTPEYNHGPSAVLKNALDWAYKEWNNKPVSFVAYGGVGGARAVEQLRLIAIELQMAPIRSAVHILLPDMMAVRKGEKTLAELEHLSKSASGMLDQLVWWARALKAARERDASQSEAA
jgi:NAD(P)H-dependent FMN reductase